MRVSAFTCRHNARGLNMLTALGLAVVFMSAGALFLIVMTQGINAGGKFSRYVQSLPYRGLSLDR